MLTATAPEVGSSPTVIVYNPDGSVRFNFMPFSPAFKGGITVTTGDLTDDGVQDIIIGAGPGADPHVEIFDGATGAMISSFDAFAASFRGGVTLATADINGDGYDDLIVGAASGSSPNVKVFNGQTGAELMSFLAFAPGMTNGVTVAGGDVNGDGYGDIIVGTRAGSAPLVSVFSGRDLSLLYSFDPFAPGFLGGVSVAAGAVNGDGKTDIVVGAGAGADPQVAVFDGATGQHLRSFLAFAPAFRGGVNVGVTTLADGATAIVAGAGYGGGGDTRYFGSDGSVTDTFFGAALTNQSGLNVS
jgi:hypothetical protein